VYARCWLKTDGYHKRQRPTSGGISINGVTYVSKRIQQQKLTLKILFNIIVDVSPTATTAVTKRCKRLDLKYAQYKTAL